VWNFVCFQERLVYAPFLYFCHQPKIILYEGELNKISIKYYKPRFKVEWKRNLVAHGDAREEK